MATLVSFVAAGYKNDSSTLDHEKYINDIGEMLVNQHLTDITPSPETFDDDFEYYHFEVVNNATGYRLQVIFQFETFGDELQLSVEISDGSYELSIHNEYLEKVKLAIKDSIRRDWKNVIWLYDKDSELLSETLYPEVYKAENLVRQLINEVMIKKYGVSWWDIFIPESISQKWNKRKVGYKSTVPGFKNVDERLMSIDIDDLIDIMFLEKKKWEPSYNAKISDIISGKIDASSDHLIELLQAQLTVEKNLWDDFKEYLPDDFQPTIKKFALDRNHVAHNKLLDRPAYRMILATAKQVQEEVEAAIKEFEQHFPSKEEQARIKTERMEYMSMLSTLQAEEAGVEIRNEENIRDSFEECLSNCFDVIDEYFRFRKDLKFEYQFDEQNSSGTFLTVTSMVNEKSVEFNDEFSITTGEGEESSLTITAPDGFRFDITYTNGATSYNEEQATSMPECDGSFPEYRFDELANAVIDYIDASMQSLYEKAKSEELRNVKDGGDYIMIPDLLCSECGEPAICIDEDFAPYGRCLNCGEDHDIQVCERCGTYFDNDIDGHVDADGVAFCENCYQEINED